MIEITNGPKGNHYDQWKAGTLVGAARCTSIGTLTESKPPYANVEQCVCIRSDFNAGSPPDSPEPKRMLVPASPPAPCSAPGTIHVIAAIYGGNCGVAEDPYGEPSVDLRSTCNGKTNCPYVVDWTVIGDPKRNCAKDYVAKWQCVGAGTKVSPPVPPEAGYKKTITLTCP